MQVGIPRKVPHKQSNQQKQTKALVLSSWLQVASQPQAVMKPTGPWTQPGSGAMVEVQGLKL